MYRKYIKDPQDGQMFFYEEVEQPKKVDIKADSKKEDYSLIESAIKYFYAHPDYVTRENNQRSTAFKIASNAVKEINDKEGHIEKIIGAHESLLQFVGYQSIVKELKSKQQASFKPR